MTPVHQTLFGNEPGTPDAGNCMQAAVASLLDLPLAEVPHFWQHPPGVVWARHLGDWLYARDYSRVWLQSPVDGAVGLMLGVLPNGVGHMVVVDGAKVIHDPAPPDLAVDLAPPFEFCYIVDTDRFEAMGAELARLPRKPATPSPLL